MSCVGYSLRCTNFRLSPAGYQKWLGNADENDVEKYDSDFRQTGMGTKNIIPWPTRLRNNEALYVKKNGHDTSGAFYEQDFFRQTKRRKDFTNQGYVEGQDCFKRSDK